MQLTKDKLCGPYLDNSFAPSTDHMLAPIKIDITFISSIDSDEGEPLKERPGSMVEPGNY